MNFKLFALITSFLIMNSCASNKTSVVSLNMDVSEYRVASILLKSNVQAASKELDFLDIEINFPTNKRQFLMKIPSQDGRSLIQLDNLSDPVCATAKRFLLIMERKMRNVLWIEVYAYLAEFEDQIFTINNQTCI